MEQCSSLNWNEIKNLLPIRTNPDANKYDFGHVLAVGGAPGFSGAIRLAAESALRTGAGLVSVITHPDHANLLNIHCPELMCHGLKSLSMLKPLIENSSVILLGPGLGREAWGKELWDLFIQAKQPKVIDADGLNLLAQYASEIKTDPTWILTPHVGEAARLLKTTKETVQKNRTGSVKALLKNYGGVLVLKGGGTLIADSPEEIFLNPVHNPGMASAGMGDVLSGIIAGLLAQGLSLLDAAKLGVMIHSQAAEKLIHTEGQRGLLATDLWRVLKQFLNPYQKTDA